MTTAADTQAWLSRANAVLTPNYARLPIVMHRGRGSDLWDVDGRQYLDLFAGFGGSILGHAHPDLVAAVNQQAQQLWHVGNSFHSEPQVRLGEALNRTAFEGRGFFCHGGADANEAAIKLAKLHGSKKKRWKIISLTQSFHGRTLATIAAGGSEKNREGFGPPMPGFTHVPANCFDCLLKAVDDETCGIIMEPIIGEGGMIPMEPDFVRRVRQLCDERDLTLIFDEVWTGGGRTGKWFGHQHLGVTPDIMTLGKAVGGGLPVGVMWAKPELGAELVPGKHGSTLGGNPICAGVAAAIFDVVVRDGLLAHATQLGELAIGRLQGTPNVKQVRGRGLFLGLELETVPADFMNRTLAEGLVVNLTAGNVVRLAPALTISPQQWAEGLERLLPCLT